MAPIEVPSSRAPSHPRLWILVAAILWSTSGLFAKAPVFATWPIDQRGPLLAFWRALFAGLLIAPLIRRPSWTPRLVLPALSFAAMNVSFLVAMTLTTAANAIWLQNTAPVWVFLAGTIFLGEPFLRRHVAALALAMAGAATIIAYEFVAGAWVGVSCGLFSGLTYASVVVSLRVLRDHDPAWLVCVNHLTAALVLLPWVIAEGVWPSGVQLVVLAAFGFFQMGLPYTIFARGLQGVTVQEASLIALAEPLLGPIWAWLVAAEVPAPWTLAGGALILVGLLIRFGLPLLRRRIPD